MPKRKLDKLRIKVVYCPAPDESPRLARVVSLLLSRYDRNTRTPNREGKTDNGQEKPPAEAPTEDALTSGGGGNDSHNEG
jgi:hypothetical protein